MLLGFYSLRNADVVTTNVRTTNHIKQGYLLVWLDQGFSNFSYHDPLCPIENLYDLQESDTQISESFSVYGWLY